MADILLTESLIEDKDIVAEKEVRYRAIDKDARDHMHERATEAALAGNPWYETTTDALVNVMRENGELADKTA